MPCMGRSTRPEHARFDADAVLGFERLTATYVTHHFNPHTHETPVVALIQGGVHGVAYRGAQVFVPPGSLLLVNPDERHTGYAADPGGWRYRVLYPELRLLQQAALYAGQTGRTLAFRPGLVTDPDLAARFTRLHALLDAGASRLERETLTLQTLGGLLARHSQDRREQLSAGQDRRVVRQVRQVRQLLDDPLSDLNLTELATQVNLSVYQLNRAFRKALGLALHDYQTQRRVHLAQALLRVGLPAAQVAVQAGFYDQSHLNRHFRRRVGVTPVQYQAAFR